LRHRIGLLAISALFLSCRARESVPPPGAPTPSQRVAPSEQTIIAEVDPSFDGQSIYITNNSSVPIVVTSIRIAECRNVASPCTLIPLRVPIGSGQRKRVFVVRPADPERAYSYRYNWTWGAAN
jgi:hypothetical protein